MRTLQAGRIHSIDAFRGITILVMIFVNELAGVEGIPDWMKHMPADVDGMTFVDVVFPAFLFIVGMSVPFAISGRQAKGEGAMTILTHTVIRSAALIVIGIFMVNADGGFDQAAMGISIHAWSLLFYICALLTWNVYPKDKKVLSLMLRTAGILGIFILAIMYHGEDTRYITPQWWGILGLIGWAYLIGSLIYQTSSGKLTVILACIGICIAYYFLGSLHGSEFLDNVFSQGGHAIHTALVLSGCALSLLLFNTSFTLRVRLRNAVMLVIALAVAAIITHQFSPISKIYATPPWALFCGVICSVLFLMLYWIIEIKSLNGWINFLKPAAGNPLLTYIIPFIIYHLMQATGISWPDIFYSGVYGIIWSAVYAVAVMAFVILLNRMHIKLQL